MRIPQPSTTNSLVSQMRAAQPFSGHFLPRKHFGKRTLRQCATSAKGDNIVLIEVDSDDFGDVIILDVPESLQEKFRKNQEQRVISIDDDDDDGSESRAGTCNVADGATTSSGLTSASTVRPSNCAHVNPFAGQEKKPVKLSKSKRTYSGKGISRNRYGLGPDSESCSSESDDSDCEVMEDSFGKFREDWEKASFRRRHDTSVSSDAEDKAGPSASNLPHQNRAEEGPAEHLKPTSNLRNLGSLNHERDRPKFAEGNEFSRQDSDAMEVDGPFTRKHSHYHGSDLENNAGPCESDLPFHNGSGPRASEHSELPEDNCSFKTSPANCGRNGIFSDNAERFVEQSESSRQDNEAERLAEQTKRSQQDNEGERFAEQSKSSQQDNEAERFSEKSKSSQQDNEAERFAEKSKSSQQDNEAEEVADLFIGKCSDDITNGTANHNIESDHLTFNGRELSAEGPVIASDNTCHTHNSELKSSSDHDYIITDRQKIKETDEYKRAMEEEWASRQQQLQRQADEARRLRNRKRAESMRIMDNERRQRQRLEEMRETRRKDEENLNMKDKLRAEVRNELRKLEAMCFDMASLLRALGIHVGGGFRPSSNEVQAAYKRACLKFHPDRLSATDLRQQVEAEEKFKLISNMKDKFLLGR